MRQTQRRNTNILNTKHSLSHLEQINQLERELRTNESQIAEQGGIDKKNEQIDQRKEEVPLSPDLLAYQKLASLLNYPTSYFLLPDLHKRILLSLKSTIPEDTNFALELLLVASFHEPELISLQRFSGLLDPLLDLIELYQSPGSFDHPSLNSIRTQALESALVLRNLLSLDSNLNEIPSNHPRLVLLILRTFHFAQPDFDHEFISLLLDLLHSLASQNLLRLDQPLLTNCNHSQNIHRHFPLLNQISYSHSSPFRLIDTSLDSSIHSNWSSHLVSSLDQLTQSSDRALVLGAYRALASIGSLSSNLPLLTNLLSPSDGLSNPPWPKAIDRALVLLALPDVELLMGVLDYLFVVTSISSIAHAICTLHRDIYPILKLLLTHLHHHRKTCNEPPESLSVPEQKWYFQPAPHSQLLQALLELESDPVLNQAALAANLAARNSSALLPLSDVQRILLTESQMKDIVNLPEPRRAQAWMSRAFEASPGSEVQQVALWLAYKTQFEHLYAHDSKFGPNHPTQMIQPADAIKITSDVFPHALPSMTEHTNGEKKFVITGMRIRPKKHLSIWKCKWKECTRNPAEEGNIMNPSGTTGVVSGHAERLYRHISKTHITPRGSKCHWLTCTYQANNRTELLYHIRTHIPSVPQSAKRTSLQQSKKNYRNEKKTSLPVDQSRFLPFKTYVHQRWESPNTGAYSSESLHHQSDLPVGQPGGGAIGIGFVSLLVIRNLIQSVSDSLNEIVNSVNQDETNRSTVSSGRDDDHFIPNPYNHHDRVLDESQLAIINLAKLVSGFPTSTKATLDNQYHAQMSNLSIPNNTHNSNANESHDLNETTVFDEDNDGNNDASELCGNGFIEKELLEFVLNDLHLHNIGFDLLKKISSISKDLYLISKHSCFRTQ